MLCGRGGVTHALLAWLDQKRGNQCHDSYRHRLYRAGLLTAQYPERNECGRYGGGNAEYRYALCVSHSRACFLIFGKAE